MTDARKRLAAPTLAMLPRVADSLSFLYLEAVRVVQDDTGVCAQINTQHGIERTYLPTASLACILLGPGTSITQPALATISRHGTTLVATGSGGVRTYAGLTSSSMTTAWLERQVTAWADPEEKLDIAKRMYRMRFEDEDIPDGLTLAQLRGLEGQHVKTHYRLLTAQHSIKRFRRNYDRDNWDSQDPVNLALSAANTCMYGIVHAAILALGCSPALGFVHSGKQHAFVYDIADLYKARVTIPLAFSLHDSDRPEQQARRRLREQFKLLRLMPTIVNDLQHLLDPDQITRTAHRTADLVHLWDPITGSVPAGVNYAEPDW
ncbi:CRISPR-associated endonuclease Cas1 2 [Actinorhabdospora filicis]|uniref:CRISPR-associated endonuclease Cas1 n=1 Tax=Actinorhabdospora filicis TaxID=1785913 RepID=A0A9W6SLB6_9ACTN|nr:type I-E CRISPR-associated endonuclease Cas1e [Actinorhabdospora filicis]GLZ78348.1 CRISPR-associated endonuclease Cas1 2 [Actinorhabdospora filicis]